MNMYSSFYFFEKHVDFETQVCGLLFILSNK